MLSKCARYERARERRSRGAGCHSFSTPLQHTIVPARPSSIKHVSLEKRCVGPRPVFPGLLCARRSIPYPRFVRVSLVFEDSVCKQSELCLFWKIRWDEGKKSVRARQVPPHEDDKSQDDPGLCGDEGGGCVLVSSASSSGGVRCAPEAVPAVICRRSSSALADSAPDLPPHLTPLWVLPQTEMRPTWNVTVCSVFRNKQRRLLKQGKAILEWRFVRLEWSVMVCDSVYRKHGMRGDTRQIIVYGQRAKQ